MESRVESRMTARVAVSVEYVQTAYHHLVLLVGPSGSGKTQILRAAAARYGWPVVNLGVELAASLKGLSPANRPIAASSEVARLVAGRQAPVVAVDNIEILFEPSLRLQPLDVLRQSSRLLTTVVVWPGAFESGALVYASSGHREHRSFDPTGVLVLPIESISDL